MRISKLYLIQIDRRIVRAVFLYVSVGDNECSLKCPQGTDTDAVRKCKQKNCGHLSDKDVDVKLECVSCNDRKQPMIRDLWKKLQENKELKGLYKGKDAEGNTPHFMYRFLVPPGRYKISCR